MALRAVSLQGYRLGGLGEVSTDKIKELKEALNRLAIRFKQPRYLVCQVDDKGLCGGKSVDGTVDLGTFLALRHLLADIITKDLPNVPVLKQIEEAKDTIFGLPIIQEVSQALITKDSYTIFVSISTDQIWAWLWDAAELSKLFDAFPSLKKYSDAPKKIQEGMQLFVKSVASLIGSFANELVTLVEAGDVLYDVVTGKYSTSPSFNLPATSTTTVTVKTPATIATSPLQQAARDILATQQRIAAIQSKQKQQKLLIIGGGLAAGVLLAYL